MELAHVGTQWQSLILALLLAASLLGKMHVVKFTPDSLFSLRL